MLVSAAICPHPPVLIPSIGMGEISKIKKTILAMNDLAKEFTASKPEAIVIISPHGPLEWSKMTINISPDLRGDFLNFGDATAMAFENDLDIAENIAKHASERKIPVEKTMGAPLDHGTMVPLYFLAKDLPKVKIIPIGYSFLDQRTHYEFGKAIHDAVASSSRRIAIVASGDLSHRLTVDAPAGYSLRGKEFDEKLIALLDEKGDEKIITLDADLIEEAGECGLKSIIILLGALSFTKHRFEKISYEGPFGVGYLVGKYSINVSNTAK